MYFKWCWKYGIKIGLVLLIYSQFSYAQQQRTTDKPSFAYQALVEVKINPLLSERAIQQRINEVFEDEATSLVFDNPHRLNSILYFFRHRFFILERKQVANEKLVKLSEVPLFNKYNDGLQREAVFNPYNFNPLKYQLDIFSPKKKMYRVDHSDYVIIILPPSF